MDLAWTGAGKIVGTWTAARAKCMREHTCGSAAVVRVTLYAALCSIFDGGHVERADNWVGRDPAEGELGGN